MILVVAGAYTFSQPRTPEFLCICNIRQENGFTRNFENSELEDDNQTEREKNPQSDPNVDALGTKLPIHAWKVLSQAYDAYNGISGTRSRPIKWKAYFGTSPVSF
jgi:hypothetical protein